LSGAAWWLGQTPGSFGLLKLCTGSCFQPRIPVEGSEDVVEEDGAQVRGANRGDATQP
jgi:hypothetical protein